MKVGKPQGVMVLIMGLLFLTAAILVLVTVPSWGNWITDYPGTVLAGTIPAEATNIVNAVVGIVFGPLLQQVGEYIEIIGYFVGSLLTLIALAITSAGTMIVRNA